MLGWSFLGLGGVVKKTLDFVSGPSAINVNIEMGGAGGNNSKLWWAASTRAFFSLATDPPTKAMIIVRVGTMIIVHACIMIIAHVLWS